MLRYTFPLTGRAADTIGYQLTQYVTIPEDAGKVEANHDETIERNLTGLPCGSAT